MAGYPLILLDELNPVAGPSRLHVLATMLAGEGGAMTVNQLLSLAEVADVSGFDEAVELLVRAYILEAASKSVLADADVFGVADSADSGKPKTVSLAELISSIFKAGRTIANARFAAATFKLFNAAGTPRALSFITAALTADRSVTLPDADVDLGRVNKMLGYDQTWQDVSGSRVASTSYQNTTGRPIAIAIRATAATSRAVEVSVDSSTWVAVGTLNTGDPESVSFIVPNACFYRINGAINTLTFWSELR